MLLFAEVLQEMSSFQPQQEHTWLDSPQSYLNGFWAKPSLPLNYSEAILKEKKKGSSPGATLCDAASERLCCGRRNGE